MKAKLRVVLLVAALVALLGAIVGISSCGLGARTRLEQTRRALRQEGYKLELAEFDLVVLPEARQRVAALDSAGARCRLVVGEDIGWQPEVGTNRAKVLWSLPEFVTGQHTNVWVEMRSCLNQTAADEACQALLSGPCRPLPPVVGQGSPGNRRGQSWWAPESLEARVMLALHDRDQLRAWTNLLALTRLMAGWQDQPHSMGFMSWTLGDQFRAFAVTWQAMQAGGWDDGQLAMLQREWEAADLRGVAAEQAAFGLAFAEFEYRRPWKPPTSRLPQPSMFRSPILALRTAWKNRAEYAANNRYRRSGRYEEEEAVLLVLRDTQKAFKRIAACSSWKEVLALPGVRSASPALASLRPALTNWSERFETLRGVSSAFPFAFDSPLFTRNAWTPVCKAKSEAERRLVVAALALERYRLRHGGFPESLDSLVPQFLGRVPLDYMDGKPLRYRPTDDGRFLLYSTGLDCVDDGGNLRDLLWPLPASAAEMAAEGGPRSRP